MLVAPMAARAAGTTPSTTWSSVSNNQPSGTIDAQVYAASAQPGGPDVQGTVEVHDQSKSYGTFPAYRAPGGPIGSNVKLATVPAGTRHFVATYSGDANYAASSESVTATVLARKTTVGVNGSEGRGPFHCPPGQRYGTCPSSDVAEGKPVTFTASIKDESGAPNPSPPRPSGTVTFLDNGSAATSVQAKDNVATWTVALPPGNHSISATYAGDAYWSPGGTNGQSWTVNVVRDSSAGAINATRPRTGATTVSTRPGASGGSATTAPRTSDRDGVDAAEEGDDPAASGGSDGDTDATMQLTSPPDDEGDGGAWGVLALTGLVIGGAGVGVGVWRRRMLRA